MDVMEAIKKRYSVRSYQDHAVETDKLGSILEAARLAPSASNRQEWRFIVVQDKNIRQRLMQAAKDQAFVGQAPVVIACCAKTDSHVMTCGQQCYPIDVAIAIEHMALKATEEGLGTCYQLSFLRVYACHRPGYHPFSISVSRIYLFGSVKSHSAIWTYYFNCKLFIVMSLSDSLQQPLSDEEKKKENHGCSTHHA